VTAPAPGPGDPSCPHGTRTEGVCARCGHCVHDVVLNGACLACGTTALDPIAMSPKPVTIIPASKLVRRRGAR
jgi:hypothetical protein